MLKEPGLGLDSDQLIRRTLSIAQQRDRYFNDLIRKFKERYPALKILYANDTMGATLNPDHPMPDFVLIVRGELISKERGRRNRDIVMIDAPLIFTDRSIAGWTMAVEQGNMDGYFQFMLNKMARLDLNKFYEYITYMARLSTDPNDPLYWKRLENTEALTKELEKLCARYVTNKSNRMADRRGFKSNATPMPEPVYQAPQRTIQPSTPVTPQPIAHLTAPVDARQVVQQTPRKPRAF